MPNRPYPRAASAARGLLPRFILSLVLTFLTGASLASAQEVIRLWPDGPPDSNGLTGPETGDRCVGNITDPTLTIYHPDADVATDGAVLVIPGGGYSVVCIGGEGTPLAEFLTKEGFTVGVLKYRLPNNHYLTPFQDAQQALRLMRSRAEDWHFSPDKVGVMGFSAGGHLASTVGTHFNEDFSSGKGDNLDISNRPDFLVLVYPVITMMDDFTHKGSQRGLLGVNPDRSQIQRFSNQLEISESTPPTFLALASDDPGVPPQNSISFYLPLLDHGVPVELHSFERGGHGFGIAANSPARGWAPLAAVWMKNTINPDN